MVYPLTGTPFGPAPEGRYLRTQVFSITLQALEEEMQIDLQDAARATVFDPEEFPATTVPELRPAFTEQQLTVAAFETLLCCTLVVPPEDQTARKLLETAYKGGHLKKEIYQQQLAALKRSEQSAAMGMSEDVGMDEYDDASVSADSLDVRSCPDGTKGRGG